MENDAKRYARDRKQVKNNFNNAANTYEKSAVLQQTVARQLIERLDVIKINPTIVYDLGSGCGLSSRLLSKKYKKAHVYEIDMALSLLRVGSKNRSRFFSRQTPVCALAEALPFADESTEMVYSNLMLQWCNDLDALFGEMRRVIKRGGLLMFSSFGPGTLNELRQSWSRADNAVHVNAFIDMHDIGDALIRAGFENPVMEVENFVLTYPDVYGLMHDLKQIGAQNTNAGRRKSLTGKRTLEKMLAEYEAYRQDDKLPATYEVVYGHAWCRGNKMKQIKTPNTISVPLSSITKRINPEK